MNSSKVALFDSVFIVQACGNVAAIKPRECETEYATDALVKAAIVLVQMKVVAVDVGFAYLSAIKNRGGGGSSRDINAYIERDSFFNKRAVVAPFDCTILTQGPSAIRR